MWNELIMKFEFKLRIFNQSKNLFRNLNLRNYFKIFSLTNKKFKNFLLSSQPALKITLTNWFTKFFHSSLTTKLKNWWKLMNFSTRQNFPRYCILSRRGHQERCEKKESEKVLRKNSFPNNKPYYIENFFIHCCDNFICLKMRVWETK